MDTEVRSHSLTLSLSPSLSLLFSLTVSSLSLCKRSASGLTSRDENGTGSGGEMSAQQKHHGLRALIAWSMHSTMHSMHWCADAKLDRAIGAAGAP